MYSNLKKIVYIFKHTYEQILPAHESNFKRYKSLHGRNRFLPLHCLLIPQFPLSEGKLLLLAFSVLPKIKETLEK